jgi:NhaA family Na+:H+ antiporter
MTQRTNMNSLRTVQAPQQVKRLFKAFREFTRLEATGGILLLATSIIAILWANSPWRQSYYDLWHMPLTISFNGFALSHDLHWWINESLMVIFFFVIGLEIKREIQVGELSSVRKATLPIAAALGGMLLPAALYALINAGTPGARGWGVPMATDIAFALGVMLLLGPRVPLNLKIFLTALAIVDDIGAVLVIGVFYTEQIIWLNLLIAAGILLALGLANLLGVRNPTIYAILGIGLWLAFLESGVHATLAGVLLAATIPSKNKIDRGEFMQRARAVLHDFEHAGEERKHMLTSQQQEALHSLEVAAQDVESPLQRLEHSLHPWVTYLIIPLFALANAGVSLQTNFQAIVMDRVSLGIIAGLLIGKQVGIVLASWLATRAGLADLPNGINWKHISAAAWLAGIGFTMALFISSLAFGGTPNEDAAKVGILVASLIAGVIGLYTLRRSTVPVAAAQTPETLPGEPAGGKVIGDKA